MPLLRCYLWFFFFALSATELTAQKPVDSEFLTCDTCQLSAEMQNAIPAKDGGIIAVGNMADGKGIALSKIANTGKLLYLKQFGGADQNIHADAIAELPDGRIWVGGFSERSGTYSAWIWCRTATGENRFYTVLYSSKEVCSVQDLQISNDGKTIFGAGIKEGKPWFFEASFDGKILKEDNFSSAWGTTALLANKTTFVFDGRRWFLYGSGKQPNGQTALFLLRYQPGSPDLSMLHIVSNPDLETLQQPNATLENASRMTLGPGGKLLLTGTIEARSKGKQAFLLALDKNLCLETAQAFVFGGSGQETGEDVIANEESTCTLFGTRKLMAGSENVVLWKIELDGSVMEEKYTELGGKYPEYAVRILHTNDTFWLCANQAKRKENKFAFLRVNDLF